ncbi:hypothetical protein B0H16DRAFT_1690188 [Mycena metata]|uniref:Uncharacterized protein n=1 Tax=Mycena metata TaxID=1033252 RepID=A0AAD7J233_9AGAR|nr:hypothetical protein B0H16DRAFT_1690188 [Mycena metata]
MSDEHYWSDSESPPAYTEYAHTTPGHTECFGFIQSGCTRPPAAGGFCAAHQGQAMWVDPKAGSITAEERREHAEGRRCCGLTKNYQLCNTSSGGKYRYCRRHHDQRTPPHVERAPGHEPAQRGIVRERMLEFLRLQSESAAGEQQAQNRWAQGEQDRLRQQRERAEEQGAQNRRAQEEQRRIEHQTVFTEPCRRRLDFSDHRVEGSPAAQAGTGFGFLILALLLLSLLVERIRG